MAERLPIHRHSLNTLREQAVAGVGADELAALAQLYREKAALEVELVTQGKQRSPRHPSSFKKHGELIRKITQLETTRWRFESYEAQWEHDTLSMLMRELERFTLEDPYIGTIASVEERIAMARWVEERTTTGATAATAWRSMMEALARDPRFKGLRLNSQPGLIPIGQDPKSKLWEFAHVQTGELPRRKTDGTLEFNESSGLVFVLVPGGTFTMGAVRPSKEQSAGTRNTDPDCDQDEGPVHDVTLDPFFISKYEMSQGQWVRATGENPSERGPDYKPDVPNTEAQRKEVYTLLNPVENISWWDADRVLRHLGLELPTEAQWEYAGRAGTTGPRWTGPDERSMAEAENVCDQATKRMGFVWPGAADWDDGYAFDAPVNAFKPNPFGLHNVLGNVHEWCRERYGSYNHKERPGDGEREGDTADLRALRAGSFYFPVSVARVTRRFRFSPDARYGSLGVRPSRSLTR